MTNVRQSCDMNCHTFVSSCFFDRVNFVPDFRQIARRFFQCSPFFVRCFFGGIVFSLRNVPRARTSQRDQTFSLEPCTACKWSELQHWKREVTNTVHWNCTISSSILISDTTSVRDASDTTKGKERNLNKDTLRPTKLASRHFTFPVAHLMRPNICVIVARVSSKWFGSHRTFRQWISQRSGSICNVNVKLQEVIVFHLWYLVSTHHCLKYGN